MKMKRTLASLALAGSVRLAAVPAAPALADGAASTRNIIGGAAVIGGTLLIINHNKQVHAKEDQMASAQAQAEENANNAQAAYQSERKAYLAQVAINNEYKHEVAAQHKLIVQMRNQLASAQSSRGMAAAPARRQAQPVRVATTSYGWGTSNAHALPVCASRRRRARARRVRRRLAAANGRRRHDEGRLQRRSQRDAVALRRRAAEAESRSTASIALSQKLHAFGAYKGVTQTAADATRGRYDYNAASTTRRWPCTCASIETANSPPTASTFRRPFASRN